MQATHAGHDRWIDLTELTAQHCQQKAFCHKIIHRFHVESVDVGDVGFVDGGTLLEWIDTAAYATAAQWCAGHCVAASVGNLHLERPIGLGELVELHADLVYTGRSSMHILVTICSGDPSLAKAGQTAQCSIVFVAVDTGGNPVEVPRWTPVTMLDLQRHRQARARVRMRRRIEGAMDAMSYTDGSTAPRTTLRFRAAAADVDSDGNVRGGRVMRWIDEAAYACGVGWTGSEVITSYIAGIRFHQPVFVGDAIEAGARIIHTGPRSVHASIHVTNADTVGGRSCVVAHGVVVVVAVGDHGGARLVQKWEPASDQDTRLDQHALFLIELRQYIEPFTTAAIFATDAESAGSGDCTDKIG
ncbi:acyl-CoA hydrolase [Mycobacterium sp. JS623]|nr:acyl-CoA hydrolase [Mycobacterium sp. JS623]